MKWSRRDLQTQNRRADVSLTLKIDWWKVLCFSLLYEIVRGAPPKKWLFHLALLCSSYPVIGWESSLQMTFVIPISILYQISYNMSLFIGHLKMYANIASITVLTTKGLFRVLNENSKYDVVLVLNNRHITRKWRHFNIVLCLGEINRSISRCRNASIRHLLFRTLTDRSKGKPKTALEQHGGEFMGNKSTTTEPGSWSRTQEQECEIQLSLCPTAQ